MKAVKLKNGVYYELTQEEILWIVRHEKDLPQIEEKDKNMEYISNEKLKALLELRDEMD